MRLLPDTIVGRMILILLLGLTLSNVVSIYAYHMGLLHELSLSRERQLAERVAAAKHAIAEVPPAERDHAAHLLSDRGLDVHWGDTSRAHTADRSEDSSKLSNALRTAVPGLSHDELETGYANEIAVDGSAVQFLLVSTQLPDGSWVNVSAPLLNPHPVGSWELIISTGLTALAVVLVSIFSVRVMTAPLRSLSGAAERLGVDVGAPRLPETGPREVRHAARAFNDMQERIRRLIADRTQTLAAISHDLKTPLTRMKLRAEFVEEDELRRKMLADLGEMEMMVGLALAFLRQEASSEEARIVDVSTILATICDDMADAGHDITLEADRHAPLRCRPLALKRALVNLIDNAIKYGGGARVRLAAEPGQLRIEIEDHGPGIPAEEREKVFSPFYRIEGSRSRESGGTGLGLTVARSIVRAHGGDIELQDRPGGGLRVAVRLPKLDPA